MGAMMTKNGLAMVVLQDNGHDLHLMTIFVGLIFVAMLLQGLGVLIAGIYAAKLLVRVNELSKSLEEKTAPILVKTHELLGDLSPKVHTIGTNVEQMSYTLRVKVDELGATISQLNETVQDANGRTRRQVAKVDGMVSEALETTEEVSRAVQEGIRGPVKQVAGIIAGLKAGLETLVRRGK